MFKLETFKPIYVLDTSIANFLVSHTRSHYTHLFMVIGFFNYSIISWSWWHFPFSDNQRKFGARTTINWNLFSLSPCFFFTLMRIKCLVPWNAWKWPITVWLRHIAAANPIPWKSKCVRFRETRKMKKKNPYFNRIQWCITKTFSVSIACDVSRFGDILHWFVSLFVTPLWKLMKCNFIGNV